MMNKNTKQDKTQEELELTIQRAIVISIVTLAVIRAIQVSRVPVINNYYLIAGQRTPICYI